MSPETGEEVTVDKESLRKSTPKTASKEYFDKRSVSWTRLIVSILLTLIFAAIVITIMVAGVIGGWDQTKEATQIVLPVVTGIYGTVLGFYFGSKQDQK